MAHNLLIDQYWECLYPEELIYKIIKYINVYKHYEKQGTTYKANVASHGTTLIAI